LLLVGIASLVVALTVSWAATPWVVRLATRVGAVDHPAGRKMHRTPIPRIGGVAVFLGFIAGLTYAALVTGTLFRIPTSGVYWPGIGIAATALFLVGLADDLWELSFRWKLVAQVGAAVYVWYAGFRIETVSNPLGGNFDLGWLALPVTVLWVVGITNAVNFIDGLDGLAAGTGVIITGATAAIAYVRGDLGVTAVGVVLAGSLLGFLWFNFNPARIFLGDSGTLFVGFVLAVACVSGNQKGPTIVAIFVPLLLLGLPVLDTSLAVARRIRRLGLRSRESERPLGFLIRNVDHIFLPDREHIHHRLIDLGLSHRNAVLTLWGVAALLVMAAFALVLWKSLLVALVLVGVLMAMLTLFFVMLHVQQMSASEADPESDEPSEDTAPEPGPVPASSESRLQRTRA
jgi:UDP-GlcNAc:undecaprenyl-phosphate GlcNAc-1-phosphate transferase